MLQLKTASLHSRHVFAISHKTNDHYIAYISGEKSRRQNCRQRRNIRRRHHKVAINMSKGVSSLVLRR